MFGIKFRVTTALGIIYIWACLIVKCSPLETFLLGATWPLIASQRHLNVDGSN